MASASNPSATKMPTHNSNCVLCNMMPPSLKHQCGHNEIQAEHRQGRKYHSAIGSKAHALGGRHCIVAFKYRNPAHDNAEHKAFYHTIKNIIIKIDTILHLRPIGASIDT